MNAPASGSPLSEAPGAAVAATSGEARRPLASRLVLAVIAIVMVLFTKDGPGSWADASRLASIESLAERGTLSIDGSTYFWQGDKVRFDDRYYSHQPPMLGVLGALPYAALHFGAGLSMAHPPDTAILYRLLTLLLVGLPVLLGLFELDRLLGKQGLGGRARAALLALAFFGTHLLPYSLVLAQHGTAAGLCLLGLGAIDRGRWPLAGLLLALASTVDLTAMFCALAFAWPILLARGPIGLVGYGVGALPPLALHFALNLRVAGDLVPFGLHAEAFRYAGSPFMLMSLTGVKQAAVAGEQLAYLRGATLGASGLFSHHPILLVAILGGLFAVLRGAAAARGRLPRGLLLATALGALGIAFFYLTGSRNFGGSSFGMRWFTVFCPFAALWAGAVLAQRGGHLPRALVPRLGLGALACWSVAAAGLGAVNPWTKFHYTYELSPQGRVPLAGDSRPATWGAHLGSEWRRIGHRDTYDRFEYDQTFSTMLDMLRRAYLRPASEVGEQQRVQLAAEGALRLEPVVDLFDSENSTLDSRPRAHFWLGKLYAASGDRVRAERALRTAAQLDPHWPAPRAALENL